MAQDELSETEANQLSSIVVTKYQAAAEIVNKSLKLVIEAVKEGATVLELSSLGDKSITESAATIFNKGKMSKGIAFPTCISPNNTLCHLSPLQGDPEASITLKNGDSIKIEMAAHVDGYIAHVAHTLVCGASASAPVTGKQADVMKAAYTACEAAVRLLKPGKTNYEVTDVITKAAKEFDCTPVEGMLSHQLMHNVLDGEKQIVLNPTDAQKKEVESFEFCEGDVFSIDIMISSGEGKSRTMESRTTVFKRNPETTYNLKMKTSRAVLTEITQKVGNMAFSLRQLEDEKKARMGLVECSNHGLVTPYSVLYENQDAHVAHFVFTVLLMPTGPLKITGLDVALAFENGTIKSELDVKDAELTELLKQSVRKDKKKKNKTKSKETVAQ